jgi:anti-anti-sigma factor
MDAETSTPWAGGGAGTEAVLRLDGMSDIRGVKRLHAAALAALSGTGDVVVDAGGVPHVDTAALQVLVGLRAAVEAKGRAIRFTGVSEGVQSFLKHAGLEKAVAS